MKNLLVFCLFLISSHAFAKLEVITTTSNLADLVKQIGGDKVNVHSLCKGVQDPHFLEAKPSYIFKLSKADLLVSIGAGLEVGWLPLVVRGSRNPKLKEGGAGSLVAADIVKLLEQETGEISRSMGDVHPEGNPHFMLAPSYSILVAKGIQEKLSQVDSSNSKFYRERFLKYSSEIEKRKVAWDKQIKKGMKVITYHKTLSYFYKDFGIENVDVLEPKPGIPPSASHVLNLIKKIKASHVSKIIVENYFDTSVAKRIKKEVPSIKIETVPVGVGGAKDVDDLFDLYDRLVTQVEG